MTEERMEKIAEEKIHLALSRLNRINTIGERFSLFGQSTLNAIREKSSQAWFSVKRLFIKTAVLGSVPVPDLPEIADETNVVIPQKVTDTAVIESGMSDESEQDIISRTHTISDTVVQEPISETVVPEPISETVVQEPISETVVQEPISETVVPALISDTVNSAQTISDTVVLQEANPKPNSEITTDEMAQGGSSMETVD